MASLYQKNGTWWEAFGEEAPELFMTYCYAKAVEQIASAGRKAYPIPLYVNAWLEQYPWVPGSYPTGGPIARHMDVWKAFSSSIDFLSPDIYLPDFEKVCMEYSACGNPLFIPEARPCMDSASNVFSAFGRFGALGFSPFAIEDLNQNCPSPDPEELRKLNIMAEAFNVYRSGEFLSQSYSLLSGMAGLLERYRGTSHMAGFTQQQEEGMLVKFSRYDFLLHFAPRQSETPKAGGLIIELTEDEFLLCGLNYQAAPLPKSDDVVEVEMACLTEGHYENDVWVQGRRLNGDEFRLAFSERPTLLRCRLKRQSIG